MNVIRDASLTRSRTTSSVGSFFSLFTSVGTLLCCALPSLLVLIGLGATVASTLSAAPWLVTLSRNKEWMFLGSGLMIGANFVYVYSVGPRLRARQLSCDPSAPEACDVATRFSRVTLWISAVVWAVGFFVAFILGPLLMRFG